MYLFFQLFLSEFVGTFFFIGTIFSVVQQQVFGPIAPLAIGGSLITSIFLTGKVSGGHFNPAVTLMDFTASKLGYWEGNAKTIPLVLVYWSAQCSAGQLGMFLLQQLLQKHQQEVLP